MHETISIGGLTLILSPLKNLQAASLGIFLKVGSRLEKKNVKGIAHFLEHMLFKGTSHYSYRKIKREIEGRGGSLNAFTSHEMTAYYAHFLKKNLINTLDIILDMVSNPLLRSLDVDRERNVILEEIKMYNDLPSSRVGMLLDRLLWKNHPLGEEVIGYASTVRQLTHRDLKDFRNKYYLPSNMVICIAGDFCRSEVINFLREKIKASKSKVSLKITSPQPHKGLQIKCEKRTLEQTHLCLGFRSISYLSNLKLIAELISIILGANMSSRLFEELREKKSLCYDISTELRKYKDSGAFLIHLGLDKSKITVAIRSILKELNKLKRNNLLSKELDRAKDYLLGQITMSLERPQGRMFYLAESYVTLGKIYPIEEIKKRIESITPLGIKRLAKRIFKFQDMCISCVGDIEDNLGDEIRTIIKKGGRYS